MRGSGDRVEHVDQATTMGTAVGRIMAGADERRRQHSPELDAWLSRLSSVHLDEAVCAIGGLRVVGRTRRPGIVPVHRSRWRSQARPGIENFLFDCATYGEPRFDLRVLNGQAKLEIQYVLQCRCDERGSRTTPRSIRTLLKYLTEQQVTSLLETSPGWRSRRSARTSPR